MKVTSSYAKKLPYGEWTCKCGRRVLFNRRYQPLWSRSNSGEVTRADPTELVEGITATQWFFNDSTSPLWTNPACLSSEQEKALTRALDALRAWGLPLP